MAWTTVVDVTTSHQHLSDPGWLFIDCRFDIRRPAWGAGEYRGSHIPGAAYADLDHDLSGPIVPGATGRHPAPERAALTATFSRLGIGPDTQVIAYDESTGALAAARLWWLLKWAGHDAVSVLNGGIRSWVDAGFACKEGEETRPSEEFLPRFREEMAVDARQVQSAAGNPGWVVLDVRSAERYRGENETIDPVAGHIPGALSSPYAAALETEGRFKPAAEIALTWSETLRGKDAAHAIVYCGSGVTAAHAALACSYAGLGVPRLYPGSWSEWITDKRRPIAR